MSIAQYDYLSLVAAIAAVALAAEVDSRLAAAICRAAAAAVMALAGAATLAVAFGPCPAPEVVAACGAAMLVGAALVGVWAAAGSVPAPPGRPRPAPPPEVDPALLPRVRVPPGGRGPAGVADDEAGRGRCRACGGERPCVCDLTGGPADST